MSSPMVSVVVPVKNAMPYLAESLDGICAQSLHDIEIICVDDGSSDGSLDMLRSYESRDGRMKVIVNDTGTSNAGATRNLGLKAAQGRYVIFLDADDVFEPMMLQKAYERAAEHDLDVVLFNGDKFDDSTGETITGYEVLKRDYLPDIDVFSATDVSKSIFQITSPSPWSQLYDRSFLERRDICFQQIPNSNDMYMTFAALSSAERMSIIDEKLIHYRTRTRTSLQDGKWKDPLCFLEALSKLEDRLISSGKYDIFRESFAHAFLSHAKYNLSTQKNHEARGAIFDALDSGEYIKEDIFGNSDAMKSKKARSLRASLKASIEQHKRFKEAASQEDGRIYSLTDFEPDSSDCALSLILIDPARFCSDDDVLSLSQGLPCTDVQIVIARKANGDYAQAPGDDRSCKRDGITDSLSCPVLICETDSEDRSKLKNLALAASKGAYVLMLDDASEFLDEGEVCDILPVIEERCAVAKMLIELSGEGRPTDIAWMPFSQNAPSAIEEDAHQEKGASLGEDIFNGKQLLVELCRRKSYSPATANYILRRQVAIDDGIEFLTGIDHSEIFFTFAVLSKAQSCIVVEDALSTKRQRLEKKAAFADAFGYCMSTHECQNLLEGTLQDWDPQQIDAALKTIIEGFELAVKSYTSLSAAQKGARLALDAVQGLIYRQNVITPALKDKYKKKLDGLS